MPGGGFRLPILVSVTSSQHHIVLEMSRWSGRLKVKHDGKDILYSSSIHFQANENGDIADYEFRFDGSDWNRMGIGLLRNGNVIFTNEYSPMRKVPSAVQRESAQVPQKEVLVREILLVVCPHCGQRNDASRRTCEKCHASI